MFLAICLLLLKLQFAEEFWTMEVGTRQFYGVPGEIMRLAQLVTALVEVGAYGASGKARDAAFKERRCWNHHHQLPKLSLQ